jgi:hypothetical protein
MKIAFLKTFLNLQNVLKQKKQDFNAIKQGINLTLF